MFNVTPADALRALKKFKRLAKQDLLASEFTSEPEFWRGQAEARRATYDTLMGLVEEEGYGRRQRKAASAADVFRHPRRWFGRKGAAAGRRRIGRESIAGSHLVNRVNESGRRPAA